MEKLSVTKEQAVLIEKSTVGQREHVKKRSTYCIESLRN